jgi:hypothetical protein
MYKLAQRQACDVENATGLRMKYLFIGRQQILDLMADGNPNIVQAEFATGRNATVAHSVSVLGLKVVVVPWFSGMFVCPELGALDELDFLAEDHHIH